MAITAELTRALERLRVLCDVASDAIVVVDRDGVIRLVNRHAETMFGYAAGDLIGHPVERLLPEPLRESHQRHRAAYVAAPRARPMAAVRDLYGLRRDGTRFPAEIGLSPIESDGVVLFCSAIRDISDRRAVAERLHEVEARFRTLVDYASDGILVTDADGRYQDVNPAGCAIFGYSRDEFLGLSIPDVVAPDELPRLAGEIDRLVDGSIVRSEWRFRRKDGTFFFGEVNSRRLPDGRLQASLRDVTERKRVDERLRENEARYRLIVENQTEFIVKWLPDGTRTFVNEQYCRLFGLREEECLGTSFFPLVAPEYHDAIRARIAGLTRERPIFTEEHVSYSHEGPRWQQWTTRAIFDAGGGLVELLSTGRDITERKRAEEQLSQSRLHLLASQRIAQVGSWEMDLVFPEDLRRNPLRLSDECYRVLGFEPIGREVTLEQFFDRVHPDDRQNVRDALHQAVTTRSSFAIEHRIVIDDGSVRLLHEQAELLLDPASGAPTRLIGTTQDITDRARLEEQLRQSQKMQAIGQLAGGVAHDFNNLLTVINGYSEMLLAVRDERDPSRAELAAIRDAGERAAQLTRQLLLFSRKAVFEPRVLDLNELLERVGVMLRRLIGEDIALRLTLAPSLPGIKADPSQLEQLVLNLALNARDAMAHGGVLAVETRAASFDEAFCQTHPEHKPGTFVQLSVSDNGSGMTAETMAHLFEPFFTTKGPGKGTGLGLATVYGIVQESDGFLTVASQLGVGTVMNVFLPVVDAAATHPARRSQDGDVLKGHETVLLVEDEPAVRSVATQALTMHGYRVTAAGNGPAALRLLEFAHDALDLLVTDVVMPEMSGGQLAQAIRQRYPSCRVLFMSGYNEDMAGRHGQLGQNDGFLQKPFTPLLLARKVREILDKPR